MFKKAISLLLSLMLIVTSLSVTIFSVSAADGSTYKVAGSDELTGDGPDWQPSAEASPSNVMTAKGDGTYEKVYTDVAVKDGYSLKIVENTAEGTYNWIGVDGTDNNFVFNVTSVCDVTVTFDPATNKIDVTGTGVEIPTGLDVTSVTAVGNAEKGDAFLNGITWNQAAEANHMTEVATGVYEITYTGVETLEEFAEVENEFKFAINDDWAHSFGGVFEGFGVESEAVYNGNNLKVCFPVGICDVTLKLDLSNFDFATKAGAKFTVSAVKQGEEPTEATTAAPATDAPTTAAPTTEAPTTAAPTTVGGKLNVKATSNYFPEQTVTLSEDEEYVTVTYFIESSKNLLNIEWDLEFDPTVLQFDPSANIDAEKECINLMPSVGDALVWHDNSTETEGKISGNASSLNLFKIKNRVAPLVTATFKVIGSGDTTVNLYVHIMGLSQLNSSLQYDEANDEYVVDGGIIQDTATKPVRTTVPHAGLYDPTATNPSGEETTAAPATTAEPTTEAPTTEAPTTEAPTTEAPTTEAPTTEAPTTEAPTTEAPTTEAPKGLFVTGTSNYFPEYTQFIAEGQEYVTVSYFLQSKKNMLNTEWALSYDTSVLQFDIDANMNATGDGYNIMPQCDDAVIGFPRDGVIKGNCSRLKLYKMGPDRYTYVTVTFKVIGTGSTNVDLFVNVLGVSKVGPPDFTTIEAEEEYPVDGGVPQEVSVKVVPTTVVYAGRYVPDVTEDPSAPTAPETTVAPTTEAPTTVAPTTEAPTTAPVSSLEIKATSNIAPEKTYTWTSADGTELVTVTYYLNSDKKLLNTQWTLKYDNTLLEVIPENNIGGFMPYIVDGADYNTSIEGVIIGNASSLNLYDLSKAPAQEFVQVTFKVKGTGSTVVDLEVSDLGLSEINPETGKSDESKEVVIIANSQTVGDIQLITTDTIVKPGTGIIVEPTTVEPTTVEPTTVEPTTVEPTTVEPTTVEPTTVEPTTVEPTTVEPTTVEPTTVEPTTVEPTTVEPTTVEPSTAPATTVPATTGPASTDPTSATDAPASPDTPSTSDTPVSPSNPGAVQTGSASMAVIILLVLVSASGVLYFTRKRVK